MLERSESANRLKWSKQDHPAHNRKDGQEQGKPDPSRTFINSQKRLKLKMPPLQ